MIEVSPEMARYLFNAGKSVYRLYSDGTEALIEEHNDILSHDGIFGVEED